jgi:hypothetical protein
MEEMVVLAETDAKVRSRLLIHLEKVFDLGTQGQIALIRDDLQER